jgi:tRNA G46 methylase TrmB
MRGGVAVARPCRQHGSQAGIKAAPTPLSSLKVSNGGATATARTTRYTIRCAPTPKVALADVVTRHYRNWADYDLSKPIADHTRRAFDEVLPRLREARSVVLDSGCGMGRSTGLLGELHPESLVVGVDRSLVRLSRSAPKRRDDADKLQDEAGAEASAFVVPLNDNVVLVRAELVDFWRLLSRHKVGVEHHYLLYPNPYPKLSRLNLRWYGNPAFPLLANLHRTSLVVRSNWRTYLDEFAGSARVVYRLAESLEDRGRGAGEHQHALDTLGRRNVREPTLINQKPSEPPLTHFEAKYREVGEPCYELRIDRGSIGRVTPSPN